ncbi:hypothetical protein REPUB_Repub07fG0199500 [Reevesia pubescens]
MAVERATREELFAEFTSVRAKLLSKRVITVTNMPEFDVIVEIHKLGWRGQVIFRVFEIDIKFGGGGLGKARVVLRIPADQEGDDRLKVSKSHKTYSGELYLRISVSEILLKDPEVVSIDLELLESEISILGDEKLAEPVDVYKLLGNFASSPMQDVEFEKHGSQLIDALDGSSFKKLKNIEAKTRSILRGVLTLNDISAAFTCFREYFAEVSFPPIVNGNKHHNEYFVQTNLAGRYLDQNITDDIELLGFGGADAEEGLSDITVCVVQKWMAQAVEM